MPCRCFLERLDERLRGERLCKKGDASRGQRSLANGRGLIPGDVDNGRETPAALRPCLSSIPDPSLRLMSRMTQAAFSKSVWLLKDCADENTMVRNRAAGADALLPSASRGHHRQLKRGCNLLTSLTCHQHALESPLDPIRIVNLV